MTLEFGNRRRGIPKNSAEKARSAQLYYTLQSIHATGSAIAFLLAIAGVPALAADSGVQ